MLNEPAIESVIPTTVHTPKNIKRLLRLIDGQREAFSVETRSVNGVLSESSLLSQGGLPPTALRILSILNHAWFKDLKLLKYTLFGTVLLEESIFEARRKIYSIL